MTTSIEALSEFDTREEGEGVPSLPNEGNSWLWLIWAISPSFLKTRKQVWVVSYLKE